MLTYYLLYYTLSGRLCKLRLQGKFRNVTLISAHAPTEDSPDAIKDEFYDKLSQECKKAHKYDLLILLGDFNAKIGRVKFIATVAGKYTLHEATSENEKRLGQLAAKHNITLKLPASNINRYINVHGCAPEPMWSTKLTM